MMYGTEMESEIVDRRLKSICIKRYLHLQQNGIVRQSFPLKVAICFPKIKVSDELINFGVIQIGQSNKHYLTIFNLTGWIDFILTAHF